MACWRVNLVSDKWLKEEEEQGPFELSPQPNPSLIRDNIGGGGGEFTHDKTSIWFVQIGFQGTHYEREREQQIKAVSPNPNFLFFQIWIKYILSFSILSFIRQYIPKIKIKIWDFTDS